MFSPWKGNDTLRYSLFLFSYLSFSFYYEIFISKNTCSTYVFQRRCLCLSPLLKYLKFLPVSCKANTYFVFSFPCMYVICIYICMCIYFLHMYMCVYYTIYCCASLLALLKWYNMVCNLLSFALFIQ